MHGLAVRDSAPGSVGLACCQLLLLAKPVPAQSAAGPAAIFRLLALCKAVVHIRKAKADMLHSEWIRKTRAGALTPRSTLLRIFDAALKTYEQSPGKLTRQNLETAWAAWKKSQPDPAASVRNASGAVTEMEAWMAIPMAPTAPSMGMRAQAVPTR